MNINAEIDKIKHDLEEFHDESLIEAVKKLLAYARKQSYETGLKPMTVDEYMKRAMVSEADIKYGKTTNIDDVDKESKNW
jgi:hypothetical protein